jgi:hypothetical protein
MTTQPVDATVDSRPLAPCGTYAAFKRHKRRGEPVDEACRLARNAAARRWYDARQAVPPGALGYDTLGRRRSRKPAARVSYTLTPAGEAALDGGRWWLTLAGYAALGREATG